MYSVHVLTGCFRLPKNRIQNKCRYNVHVLCSLRLLTRSLSYMIQTYQHNGYGTSDAIIITVNTGYSLTHLLLDLLLQLEQLFWQLL